MQGWQANLKRIYAKPVVLGLCPKLKNPPLCGGIFIDNVNDEGLKYLPYVNKESFSFSTDSNAVMVVFDKNNPLTIDDKIQYRGKELTVTVVLKDSPFSSSVIPTVLCSEETFEMLTGIDEYAVIDIQVTKNADSNIDKDIRKLLGDDIKLSDGRESKRSVNSTYLAFSLLVY